MYSSCAWALAARGRLFYTTTFIAFLCIFELSTSWHVDATASFSLYHLPSIFSSSSSSCTGPQTYWSVWCWTVPVSSFHLKEWYLRGWSLVRSAPDAYVLKNFFLIHVINLIICPHVRWYPIPIPAPDAYVLRNFFPIHVINLILCQHVRWYSGRFVYPSVREETPPMARLHVAHKSVNLFPLSSISLRLMQIDQNNI